jgi:hypothetical protein
MNVVALVRVTRKSPALEVRSAMLPVDAKGEFAAIVAVTAAPLRLAATVGSGDPGIEFVGLLQPGSSVASPPEHAAIDATRLQKSRRVWTTTE